MKRGLVSLNRTVKSACQATREAKKIAQASEVKLKKMKATLKSERELHHYEIELKKASSAKALIKSEKDAMAEAKAC